MTVKDLIEKLQLVDSEMEVLVIDEDYYPRGISYVAVNERYDDETENGESPLCIKIN